MCYSAQIWAEFRKFAREFGAVMNVQQYVQLFWERRKGGAWRKIPKAMKDAFASPRNDAEREIAAVIAEGNADEAHALEAELFQQKTRLTNAERALQSKPTKKAEATSESLQTRLRAHSANSTISAAGNRCHVTRESSPAGMPTS